MWNDKKTNVPQILTTLINILLHTQPPQWFHGTQLKYECHKLFTLQHTPNIRVKGIR